MAKQIADDFIQSLDFDSDTFEDAKRDMNFVLQRLLGNMVNKHSTEGTMTVKIDVELLPDYITIDGAEKEINKPQFKHKVTSQVKITDEMTGNLQTEMELAFDEETGRYYMRPVMGADQMNIYDVMQEKEEAEEVPQIAGFRSAAALLPPPEETIEELDDYEEIDGEPED